MRWLYGIAQRAEEDEFQKHVFSLFPAVVVRIVIMTLYWLNKHFTNTLREYILTVHIFFLFADKQGKSYYLLHYSISTTSGIILFGLCILVGNWYT